MYYIDATVNDKINIRSHFIPSDIFDRNTCLLLVPYIYYHHLDLFFIAPRKQSLFEQPNFKYN
jgi:hypothetical protein